MTTTTKTNSAQYVTQENTLLFADSYKFSQPGQYPPEMTGYYGYGSARFSSIRHVNWTLFSGLQAFIKSQLMKKVTLEDVIELQMICKMHGEPLDIKPYVKLVKEYDGIWPFTIRAVKEGTILTVGNVMFTLECTDPDIAKLASSWETSLLRAVWYPTTVGTISKHCKNIIMEFLERTCDNPKAEILFKLHDFGARSVSSQESAGIGGLAHLINFRGTDTIAAIIHARRFYSCEMAGFSIPASEHSTITSWGRTSEVDAYRNMLKLFGVKGGIFACVSDSFNIFDACEKLWGGELRDEVIASGATLVIRPDSGDPLSTVVKVISILAGKFGYTVNGKGFKVLNHVRVIQGDGVDPDTIRSILYALSLNQYSAENIAFGMGGGLLQKVDRDIFGFAMKCSSIRIKNEWVDVYKDPIGGGKTSMKGRLALIKGIEQVFDKGAISKIPAFVTKRESELMEGEVDLLEIVYRNGVLVREQTLDEIRAIADA